MTTRKGDQIGYARVSTVDQHAGAQLAALRDAGCLRVFTDHASGVREDRPQLAAVLDHLRSGDSLVVWRLDRVGRSLPHLLDVVRELRERGVQFRSLTEAIDTTTPSGQLMFHLSASFAHYERQLIIERTRAGLAAARAEGRVGGRPTVMTPEKIRAAQQLIAAGDSQAQVARALGVGRTSVRRALGLI